MDKPYFILNKNNPDLYWNNELGWASWECATVFSAEEKETLCLPIEGQWENVYEDGLILVEE